MPGRKITFHTCQQAELDDGAPIRGCSCRKVAPREARELVDDGTAEWKKKFAADEKLVNTQAEIVVKRFVPPWHWRKRRSGDAGPIVRQLVRE